MAAVVVERTIDLASPADDVWPLLTDTDRLNRLIGVGAITTRPLEGAQGTAARFLVATRAGGFALEYEELPFEWTHGRSFGVLRRMRGGPLVSYGMSWKLDPHEGGTRAHARLELVPRFALLRPIAIFEGRKVLGRIVALAQQIDDHVRGKAASPYVRPVAPVSEETLAFGVRALGEAGVPADLVARIEEFLRSAPDADLVRIRPFEIADRWQVDRRDVLRAMLRGVPAGLFELRWAVVCPSCRTASEQYRSLGEIRADGHCHLCDLTFGLDLDRAVEATFFPHPSVRRSSDQLFCIGGPARTPHVLAQVNLGRGETRALRAPVAPGRYRLFVRGGAAASVEVTAGGPPLVTATAGAEGVSPAAIEVAPGGDVRITNDAEERHAKIERLGWASDAATGHHVSTLPEFRDLFASDLLKRSTPLKVARVAVLFSDLTGSTALYTRVGDAAAFRLVDDHFDVVRAAIERHEGVLVKTMGDAVMAAFPDGRQCARAATEALAQFEEFRRGREHGELVGIKLGMFAGACYVVTANASLDYFGQTVNVASRVQHLADAGEIVLAEDFFAALPAEERAGLRVSEPFEARVKGVDGALRLVRARLAEPRAGGTASAVRAAG